jgi:tetratricopeptide (TPR) repeat protein
MISCQDRNEYQIDKKILASLGAKHKKEFQKIGAYYENILQNDPKDVEAMIGVAESEILVYAFGYVSNASVMTKVESYFEKAYKLDSLNSNVQKLKGVIHFIKKEWKKSEIAFKKSIEINPENLNSRHWYSLYLMAMKRVDESMEQSDVISEFDKDEKFLLARGSLYYFQYKFEEMKPLMYRAIENDPEIPWAYDWLGMAYNGLKEHDDAIKTYIKAFNLSDGTVEVGGGLGHALADAGEIELAKQMTSFYDETVKTQFLPPVQRAFIHIGLKEYDKAIQLLEQAYKEQSWFLLFMQMEHWYDPLKNDPRFNDIIKRMGYP